MAKVNYLNTEIRVNVNSQEAVDGLQAMYKGMEKIRTALKDIEEKGITDDNRDKYNQLANDLNKMEQAAKKLSRETLDLGKIFDDLSGQSLATLNKALKKVRDSIKNLDPNKLAEQGKDYREEMTKLQVQEAKLVNQINEHTGANNRLTNSMRSSTESAKKQGGVFSQVAQRLAAYVSIYGAYGLIKNTLTDVAKENIALSDSLADIRKVTGMTSAEVNELSKSLTALDTRTTTAGLHELAYEAGKIGLKGVDDVMQFVKAGNQIKVALGEDLGENALVELMKMSEVMGTTKTMGVEKSLLAIGSSINELSASSTASGEDINGFAKRLSGVAAQANITTDQLLGLGSASSAMNMEVEVAATAFNKFINQIVAKTDVVAKAAGIEFEVLDEMIKSGETMEATVLVLEKLGQKGGLRALGPIMGDLGSNGSRLNNVLATFSENVDLLKTHLNTSSTAFEQAISVTNEYNIKNENAAAILARMGNTIKDKFINSGVTEWLTDILRKLYELPKAIEENKIIILAALGAITIALTGVEFKVKAMMRLGIGKSLLVLGKRLLALGAPLKTLLGLMAANPFTVAAAAIGVFTAAMVNGARKADLMGQAMRRVKKSVNENNKEIDKETIRVSQLFDWLKRAEKGTENYNKAKQTILSNYGQYLKGMGDEIEKLEDIEGAYNAITKAATKAAKARMAEKSLTTANEAYASTTGDIYTNIYDTMQKQKTGRIGKRTQVYSYEEIDNFVNRLRPIVETGGEIPADMQSIIDSFTRTITYTNTAGVAMSSQVNPLQAYVDGLRNAKRALDAEVLLIEEKFGKLEEVLAGNEEEEEEEDVVPDLTPEQIKAQKLQAAKTEQQAVLAALEVYYAQQQQVVNQQYLDKEITVTEREKRLADIEKRMLESRIAARRALLGEEGAAEEWQAELSRMDDANLAISDENAAALATLYGKNLNQIGEALRKFGDNEMDGIRKNMEQDRLTIQTNAVQMRQEIEQILLENDFTGKVTQQYMAAMQKLNLFFPEMEEDMKASAEWLMQGLHEIYPKLFDVDILTEEGLNAFRNMVLNAKGATVEMATQGADAMRLLYYQILEYGDAMENANRQARKAGQRVTEEKWRQSGGMERLNNLSAEEKHINSMNSMLSGVGLMSDEVANDAMIELYRKRVEELQKLRDLTIQNNGDIEEANKKLEEAMNNLSEAVVDKTLAMLETLKSFTDTLPEFGSALGEAFATEDATERMEALQEATKDFVQDLGEATKEMIVQWVKQKIQHALLKKSMVSTEKQTQGEITDTQQEGTEAQTAIAEVGGTLMQNIASKVKDFVVGKKKEQASESVQTEASETSANATMGIASGAAKTVGELGWWGIPLVAVITALLNGLLSYAMGKVGNLFSGKSAEATAAPAATGKVVSGMPAYDSGNVQSVLGSDGNTYAARVGGLGSGSGIVTAPTLTNVGGQAALVGELGPEVVIGRATTRAMMQDNPRLLHSLVQFDRLHSGRGFRTYDSGNLTDFGGIDGSDNPMAATIDRMNNAIDRLNRRLEKDIVAHIVRKEVVTEAIDGMYEEKQRGRNKNLTRLLG